MSKRPHFAYFIGEEAVSFLCVSFLRVFEVSSFVVTINFIYILECGTIKGQKIQVLYADLLIEQTGLKKKKKDNLIFHRIVLWSVKWDIHERIQIVVSLFPWVFIYTLAVGCVTFPQRFILGARAKSSFFECQYCIVGIY